MGHTPVVPLLERLRQDNHEFDVTQHYISEFQASLSYIVKCYLKNKDKIKSGNSGAGAESLVYW
jgi:ferredoxin-NADP reductase